MSGYKSDNRIVLYDDRIQESFFEDLSDMKRFTSELFLKIKSGEWKFGESFSSPGFKSVFLLNKFESFFESISIFKFDPEERFIEGVVTFTKNKITNEGVLYYSVGYFVDSACRNQGLCKTLVSIGKMEIETLFQKYGAHTCLGPDSNFLYVLESVVEQENTASNIIAGRYLNNHGSVETGEEARSGKRSNVYHYSPEKKVKRTAIDWQ